MNDDINNKINDGKFASSGKYQKYDDDYFSNSQNRAKQELGLAESEAANGLDSIGDGNNIQEGLAAKENQRSSFGKLPTFNMLRKSHKGHIGRGFRIRKAFPGLFILAVIAAGGGVSMFVQSAMPFHVVESFVEMFDGSYTSRVRRAPKLLRWVFDMENSESAIAKRHRELFGEEHSKFRMSTLQNETKLRNDGFVVVRAGEAIPSGISIPQGSKIYFADGENVEVTENGITSDTYHDRKLRDSVIIRSDADGSRVITANKFTDMYENDASARNDFNHASRGFVGRIAAWADLSVARFLKRFSLTRNMFGGWINDVMDREGNDTKFMDIIRGKKSSTSGVSSVVGDINNSTKEGDLPSEKVSKSESIEVKRAKYSEILDNVANIGTAAVCGTAAVSATVAAIKTTMAISNAVDYYSAFAESVDKVKGGDGSRSPINAALLELLANDSSGNNALRSEGILMILSGGSYTPKADDASTIAANIESAFRDIGSSVEMLIGCSIAGAVTAGVSVVLSIASLGTFSLGKAVIGAGFSAIVGVAADQIIDGIIESTTTDFCLDKEGLDRGTCLALGGSKYLSTNFQVGGGSPGTLEKVSQFYDEQKIALVQEAEYDRQSRSPFDITSNNTFMGAIAANLINVSTAGNDVMGIISGFGNLFKKSVNSLLPTASAIERAEYLSNIRGDCENLESIGAVGDIYCNPIYITDIDTIKENPERNMNNIATMPNETGITNFKMENGKVVYKNGTEVINPNSNLGKYILYCTGRESQFGIVDQNITNSEANFLKAQTGDESFDDVANNILGVIPVVGDIIQLGQSVQSVEALPWSTGANCVARDEGSTELSFNTNDNIIGVQTMNTLDWAEVSMYQRYVEDDRFMQSVDPNYSSSVVAFLEDYETNHPVDDSLEGILARRTGYTKEQIIQALDTLEQEVFLADYRPAELMPTPRRNENAEYSLKSHEPISIQRPAVIGRLVVFGNNRYRNFAI